MFLHLKWISERRFDAMSTLLGNKCDEIFDRSISRIFDWGVFLASGVELDRGEAADIIWNVVEGGITFGYDNFIGMGSVERGELFIFGSKIFAVTALLVSSG